MKTYLTFLILLAAFTLNFGQGALLDSIIYIDTDSGNSYYEEKYLYNSDLKLEKIEGTSDEQYYENLITSLTFFHENDRLDSVYLELIGGYYGDYAEISRIEYVEDTTILTTGDGTNTFTYKSVTESDMIVFTTYTAILDSEINLHEESMFYYDDNNRLDSIVRFVANFDGVLEKNEVSVYGYENEQIAYIYETSFFPGGFSKDSTTYLGYENGFYTVSKSFSSSGIVINLDSIILNNDGLPFQEFNFRYDFNGELMRAGRIDYQYSSVDWDVSSLDPLTQFNFLQYPDENLIFTPDNTLLLAERGIPLESITYYDLDFDTGEYEEYDREKFVYTSSSSIEIVDITEEIIISPNPTFENLGLNNPLLENASFKIYDSSGKAVQGGRISGMEVSVSGLAAGSYSIIIEGRDKKLCTGKFVKL